MFGNGGFTAGYKNGKEQEYEYDEPGLANVEIDSLEHQSPSIKSYNIDLVALK